MKATRANLKGRKEKPTKWWAESISRGDMEETVLSINPYLNNASAMCRNSNIRSVSILRLAVSA
jgi:hypothetical protein